MTRRMVHLHPPRSKNLPPNLPVELPDPYKGGATIAFICAARGRIAPCFAVNPAARSEVAARDLRLPHRDH